MQTLPSLSQARGQIQGSQAWLCTAHARPTPAATQRGDPYPKKPEFLPLAVPKTWEAAGKSSATTSPVKCHILPLLYIFTKTCTQPRSQGSWRNPRDIHHSADHSMPLPRSQGRTCVSWLCSGYGSVSPRILLPPQKADLRHTALTGNPCSQAKQEHSTGPGLLTCCLLWHRPRTKAVRGCAHGLQHLAAPPLSTPPEVQHTRTESVLKTDFLQALGDAPLAF